MPQLSSNDKLVLAGTLHGVHAICARISPITTTNSTGLQVLESDRFDLTIYLTRTGEVMLFVELKYI